MTAWQQIERILDQVLELDEPERTRYIEEKINDDEVKAEIRSLLQAELHTPAWIDTGVEWLMRTREHIHDIADSVRERYIEIDRYKIVKELGRGGMSVVYLAERTDGEFDQQVAVKIIQPFGLDREDRFRRLRAERQILASLKHPNIARVFDGGITPEGWPYMVMELVDGMPVTTYCREKILNLHARLELFLKICDAVIYAHRNLVVHRDLKPENILVTESGDVKLLDFGIAKLLAEDADASPLTQTGKPLMTPQYAAPEQFRGEIVTTAVDVYSLGVILYELLTGVRPYDLSGKSIAEMERLVCEEEPSKPSEASVRPAGFVSDRPKNFFPGSNSSHGKPDGFPLPDKLRGDLDVISLKALRKEPDERYKSVQELKEDLARYRQELPIQARPASFGYRTQKFIQRNKASLVTVALFLIAIIGFAIYHIYQVTEQRNIAQLEAEKATRIKNFTTDLFYSNNPYSSLNVDEGVTLKQVLETGIKNIETKLADEPEVYAEMQQVVGHALIGLGDYENAKISLETSLEHSIETYGENHASVASSLSLLGRLEGIRGNYEAALSHLNRALDINRILDGEASSKIAVNYAEIGRIYALERDYENASENFKKGLQIHGEMGEEQELDYNLALSELINIQIRQGLLEEAERNQRRALDNIRSLLGERHLSVSDAYERFAEIYYYKSNFSESEKYARKALEIKEVLLGVNHPQIINTLSFLGHILGQRGRYKESERYHQKSIQLFTENERTDSLALSSYVNNLGIAKSSMGQLDSAAVLHQQVLSIRNRLLPADHSSITLSMYNLADVYYRMKNLEQARTLFEQVVERDKRSLGEEHREVAVDLVKLASVYRDLQEFQEAEQAFQEAEIIFTDQFSENHYRLAEFYREYGRLKMVQGKNDQAFELLSKSMAIFQENYDDDHKDIQSVRESLTTLSGNVN